jgi:hypothetical protein
MKDSGPNQSAQPVPNYFRSTCVCQCPNSCPNLREGYWVLQDCRVETPDWGGGGGGGGGPPPHTPNPDTSTGNPTDPAIDFQKNCCIIIIWGPINYSLISNSLEKGEQEKISCI